ncbi:MAG TPA: hypothetical protein VFL47_00170 [Flavisolibacter sp.]|nr:hypothetical protein [Flavisolibacter sp.]
MKPLSFLLLFYLLLNTNRLYAQLQPDVDLNSQNVPAEVDYLKKAKGWRTGGIVLLSGGITMMLIGAGTGMSNMSFNITLYGSPSRETTRSGNKGLGLFIAGGLAAVSSIPMFIAAANNNRKARLITGTQSILMPSGFKAKQTTVGLAFPIGR